MLSLLFGVIALIPTLLSIFLFNLYGKTRFTVSFFVTMLCITLWQFDDSLLYLTNLPMSDAIYLVKCFRIGQIMVVPTLLYSMCVFFREHSGDLPKVLSKIFNLRTVQFMYGCAIALYLINWTPSDIQTLQTVFHSKGYTNHYYVPVYGPLSVFFKGFILTYIVLVIAIFVGASKLTSKKMKHFIYTMNANFTIIFLVAIANFLPNAQYISSAIVVLITSTVMTFAFMKLYNDAITSYHKEIERKSKVNYVGNMTSSLIHEIKNALTIINGSADLLKAGIINPELINGIVMGSQQLNELVQNFQAFIKSDMNLKFELAEVNAVINKAIALSKNVTESAGVQVRFESDTKQLNAHINEQLLTQVLVNLIKNSAEAIPAERDFKNVYIELSGTNDLFVIDVKDNGCGIPQNRWETIFSDFASTKEYGLGLGLPFCLKIVLAHRGTIRVVESSSNGTHMQIAIPKHKFDYLIAG